jgi:hypothetical protein
VTGAVGQDVEVGGAAVVAVVAAVVTLAAVAVAAAAAVDNVIAGWHEDAFHAVTEADTALVGRLGSLEAEGASGFDARHLHCCASQQSRVRQAEGHSSLAVAAHVAMGSYNFRPRRIERQQLDFASLRRGEG